MAVAYSVKTDTLKRRYVYKLSTNLVGLVINLVTQAIIPRGLGPKAYGDFNFLTNFFSQVVALFDTGTSTKLFTKLSMRPKETSLVLFYLYFCGSVSLLVMAFVVAAGATSIRTMLWPGQDLMYIYLGALFALLLWLAQIFNLIVDAYGLTVPSERARMIQKFLGMVLIILLYFSQKLNLLHFFFYHYLLLILLITAFIHIMKSGGYALRPEQRVVKEQFGEYVREFYTYSHPLFLYSLIGVVVNLFDRWILQIYGGSIEQGFFSLSYQIGAICFLFTSAMTPLLTREFSIAYGNNDLVQIAVLFQRYIPILYSVAAYFSCFIAVQADKMIYLFGGNKYTGAAAAVSIMALFPLHQTYGQLSGSVFLATDQTKLYRNIGIIFMVIGIPVTYFLVAPNGRSGVDAGATGLALKMVLLQFVGVNTQLYYNTKYLKLPFVKYLGHQLISVTFLLGLAYVTSLGIESVIPSQKSILLNFFVAGVAYTLATVVTGYYLPIIFGLRKSDIEIVLLRVKEKLISR